MTDKVTTRAATLWANWEKNESGWQKKVVEYGNKALQRIPYEEWGLKSIPPLSARRKEDELSGKENIEVSFPSSLIPEVKVTEVLRMLGTERQALHKTRMMWSFVGMPITAPVALIPVIPNIPFFYLVYRAWSHWRALSGSKHIEFLLDRQLINTQPSKILNELYSAGNQPFSKSASSIQQSSSSTASQASINEETMVLHKSDGKLIAQALEIPELEVELDRAVWQVETALKAEEELEGKAEMAAANPKSKEKK